MNILGISAWYHDAAACLVTDGRLVAAAQEERFTRKKHDPEFPHRAIESCLEIAGLRPDQIDAVGFYDKPFLKFERLLETYLACAPHGLRSFQTAMPVWLNEKLFLPDRIAKELGTDAPIYFAEHHVSHAASAFYPSPFREAAILTVDGVGEWATTTFGAGRDATMELLGEIRFPHSLGLLYSAFTYYTGFRVNSGEYKLMGLAPYGEPTYVNEIRDHLIDVKDDGSFRLNLDYFDYPSGLRMTSRKFHDLFGGPPKTPDSRVTQKEMDLARSIQVVLEDCLLKLAMHVRRETGMKHLVMAGGVALNCVANGRLLREGIFEDLWIQPAAGDAGGALGVALELSHRKFGHPRVVDASRADAQHGSYLGPEFGRDAIRAFLDSAGAKYEEVADEDVASRTAEILAAGNVVGWFQGRMEFGPRALGGRSILGDARDPDMQSRMNLKIKYRESFRPFAPSVLAERSGEVFEEGVASPYMLLVTHVRPERRRAPSPEDAGKTGIDLLKVPRSDVPAITHVDHSARVQTVHRETNPRYHRLLEEFHARTGCPLVINTSFNVRGEPIVCTPEDAWNCFLGTEMDVLVAGPFVLRKTDQDPAVIERVRAGRRFEAD
ncbi:MAG: carbamoyltransferase [Gemmatimonadetes bacterium]|nr:carbamoyltransferase [Gemmatimonadota bacterium]